MSDLETRLRDHFADRTDDLPTTGPGLDASGPVTAGALRGPRYGAIALIAAASIALLGLGGLFLSGRDDRRSLSTAETGPSSVEPGPATTTSPLGPSSDELQPVETLPDSGDVSETPVTAFATEPIDWYRMAPDLDISWYSDDAGPSMFCWRTPAVTEPQCSVDPLAGSVLPLVVPTAGGQTLVLAGVDRADPVVTVNLEDGTETRTAVEVDDILDMGVVRLVLVRPNSIVSVGGLPVAEPIALEDYIPAFLSDFVGLDLADFSEQAAGFGFTTRVIREDGESLRVTADRRGDRINVATVDGKVTELFPVG